MMGKVQDQIQACIDYKEEPTNMVTIRIEDNYRTACDIIIYVMDTYGATMECSVEIEPFGKELFMYVIHIRSKQT